MFGVLIMLCVVGVDSVLIVLCVVGVDSVLIVLCVVGVYSVLIMLCVVGFDSVLIVLCVVGVDSVLIMLDVSASNEKYLVHIQHSMRQLMQEQLANKRYFNIIAYVAAIYMCMYS